MYEILAGVGVAGLFIVNRLLCKDFEQAVVYTGVETVIGIIAVIVIGLAGR